MKGGGWVTMISYVHTPMLQLSRSDFTLGTQHTLWPHMDNVGSLSFL